MVAYTEYFIQRANLERHVVQARAGIAILCRLEQSDAVMVRVQADERGAARHHVLLIQIGDPKPEHVDVETNRSLHVGDEQRDMADLAQLERRTMRPFQFSQRYSHCRKRLLAAWTVVSWPSTGLAIAASSERTDFHSSSGRTIPSEPI